VRTGGAMAHRFRLSCASLGTVESYLAKAAIVEWIKNRNHGPKRFAVVLAGTRIRAGGLRRTRSDQQFDGGLSRDEAEREAWALVSKLYRVH
jgi:hypothetical protein